MYIFRDDSQIITDLSEVHSVGTFVQIHEMQDLGTKLRLVVMAHRRIKIVGPVADNGDNVKGMLKVKRLDHYPIFGSILMIITIVFV